MLVLNEELASEFFPFVGSNDSLGNELELQQLEEERVEVIAKALYELREEDFLSGNFVTSTQRETIFRKQALERDVHGLVEFLLKPLDVLTRHIVTTRQRLDFG